MHKRSQVEEKTVPENRSEAEIPGYRDVLNTIHANHHNIPFTVRTVRQLHRDLMKYVGKEGNPSHVIYIVYTLSQLVTPPDK